MGRKRFSCSEGTTCTNVGSYTSTDILKIRFAAAGVKFWRNGDMVHAGGDPGLGTYLFGVYWITQGLGPQLTELTYEQDPGLSPGSKSTATYYSKLLPAALSQ